MQGLNIYGTIASGVQMGVTLGEMKNQITVLQQEVVIVKQEVQQLKTEIKSEFSALASKFDHLEKLFTKKASPPPTLHPSHHRPHEIKAPKTSSHRRQQRPPDPDWEDGTWSSSQESTSYGADLSLAMLLDQEIHKVSSAHTTQTLS